MCNTRLGNLFVTFRAAIVIVLFVAASLPQLVGAHARAGSNLQGHQVVMEPVGQQGAISGHCQLGQECSALAVLERQMVGARALTTANFHYLSSQTLGGGRVLTFDPPPPRILL